MIEYKNWQLPYSPHAAYRQRVAYFSMEYGIHQALKIYSGGLGFLSGSHMRSAYDLKQNLFGVGILWRYGYYDQVRDDQGFMAAQFQKKFYTFLEETDIQFSIPINGKEIKIQVFYLAPEVFGTAPMFLMSADFAENDEDGRKYTYRLYDNDHEIRIAQNMILGIGGAKIVEMIGGADIYHMNEGHALPLTFYLFNQIKDIDKVRERVVFTTHTPERAGNEEHEIELLNRMGFFSDVPLDIIRIITHTEGSLLGYTPAALYMSKIANGVSQLHGIVAKDMWKDNEGTCDIIAITNAQNKKFWADKNFDRSFVNRDADEMGRLKSEMKEELFEVVANQTGKIFNKNTLTIVWARRFASYKRANLLLWNKERFLKMLTNKDFPVQIIWAGKPYPTDYGAINIFNDLIQFSQHHDNCAVLTGYELHLSYLLKRGADVWLNTPRRPHEASGTSGMTAAMNGAVNVSISDGWIPEFAKQGVNAFVTPVADNTKLSVDEIDAFDHENMMTLLENEVIPTYYTNNAKWMEIVKNSIHDVIPYFDSDRMVDEYYKKLYQYQYNPVNKLIKSVFAPEN